MMKSRRFMRSPLQERRIDLRRPFGQHICPECIDKGRG
jgi:hypothetical protein